MNGFNGWRKKLALLTMVLFIFSAVGSALPLPDRSSSTGFVVKVKPASKNVIKKRGFPWLWVIGGALVAGVAVFLLVHKSSSNTNDNTEVKDPDLELEWLFSGNAQDSSGKNLHGTVYGAVAIPDRKGAANSAYSFDGISQYVEGPKLIAQKNNQFSISLWIKITSASQIGYPVYCNDCGIYQGNAKVGMTIRVPQTGTAFAPMSTNVWTHVVGTFDGQTINVYVNGVLAATKSYPGNIVNPQFPFRIGRFADSYWSGAVDDIRLYSRVISQSDITKLYNE
jgi:hypothetical protein